MKKENATIVLIPHYNDFEGLLQSIGSINSAENTDVLVVDDGSKTAIDEAILQNKFSASGSLFFLYLPYNKGIEYALNEGLQWILGQHYTYVARLDAGDFCVPNRLAQQEYFLNQNRTIGLLGTFAEWRDADGTFIQTIQPPLLHTQIVRKAKYTSTIFVHPTIMFRTDILQKTGLYPIQYPAAEDFAFYFRVFKHTQTANLPIIGIQKIQHAHSISVRNRKKQAAIRLKILAENFDGSFLAFFGIIINSMLWLLPLWWINGIKKWIK